MKSRCCLLITGTLCVWVFGYGVLEYVVGIHLYRQLFFVLVASILNSDHFLQLRTRRVRGVDFFTMWTKQR